MEGAGEVETVVDAVLTSTGVDILVFIVLGCVASDAVDDEVVLISACVEVLLLLVLLLSAGVEAEVELTFNTADVVLDAVAQTVDDEVVVISASVDFIVLPVVLGLVVPETVDAEVAGVDVGPALLLVVVGPPGVARVEAVVEKERLTS